MPQQSRDAYAEDWEDAEVGLGREDFADVFLHRKMIVAKERGRRELLKEFPEQVLDAYLPRRAREFMDDLLIPYVIAYAEIEKHPYSAMHGAEKVNSWFKRLDLLDNNDWRPIAMWALRHHHDDPQTLDQILRALERLAGSMFIRREYSTPRIQRYVDALRQLDDGAGPDAPAFALSSEERKVTLDALNGEVYGVAKTRKYILLRLDEVLAQSPGVTYDLPVVTVEHVLPQTPVSGSDWLKEFSNDERAFWTHRLANLVLLNRYKNSEAQNYDFDKKKQKYFTGKHGVVTFALTTQVVNEKTWTPEVLRDRQERLLATFRHEWGL